VISQQVLLLRPNASKRFPPKLHTNLPLRSNRVCRQTPLDRVQSSVRSKLLQSEGCFILAGLDLCCRELMPVNPDIRGLKGQSVVTESVTVSKIALHFKIELLRIISRQIDPCPTQPKTVLDCGLTKIPVESKCIAAFGVNLDKSAEHQLQLRSTLLDVNGQFLLHDFFDIRFAF